MISWSDLPLTTDHAALLESAAISAQVAQQQGLHSITAAEQLPAEFAWIEQYGGVPALAFPWKTTAGTELTQLRVDEPFTLPGEKRPAKYLWPKGSSSPVGIVRTDDDGPVYIVEGTKQALAAASVAVTGAVYSIAGCRAWSTDGVPVDLDIVDGRDAVLIFDADVATNLDVHTAAAKLTAALKLEGAASVSYVLLPVGGTAGLDDVLGRRAPGRRTSYFTRLAEEAVKKLPAKPAAKKAEAVVLGGAKRPAVDVGDDRLNVIGNLTTLLRNNYDGTELFHFGTQLCERLDTGGMRQLNRPLLYDRVQQVSTTVTVDDKGGMRYADPSAAVLDAVLISRAAEFTQLDRIATVPFVRPDGTICTAAGYDAATCTYLTTPMDVVVPDSPTADDVRGAVKLLCDDWLADFMAIMPSDADKANALALLLTPLVRSLIGIAPLAVINGLQMGVGKNLLGDILSIFATGTLSAPLPFSTQDDELRKVILATFRSGRELFIFDEAHSIGSPSLARAITSPTYTDRVLGASQTAEFPNNVTWMSMGNNVVINGDMSRRVYIVRLAPTGANPQDRSADEFRHPDIKNWTREHRAELVGAALTLVRAWFEAGSPLSADGRKFGSFEQWGGVIGGILANAGVHGFLTNQQEWRSESDYDTRYWMEHFGSLAAKFGTGVEFTCAEVMAFASREPHTFEMPPGMTTDDHPRVLGQKYANVNGRTYGTHRLVQTRPSASRAARWMLETDKPSEILIEEDETTLDLVEMVEQGGTPNLRVGQKMSVRTRDGVHIQNAYVGAEPFPPVPPVPPEADPGVSPAAALRGAVSVTPNRAVDTCADCDGDLELVPPALFWYACRRCTPSTFTRS